MYLPPTASVGVIHCGINDINSAFSNAYRPHQIAENVIRCGFKLRERHPLMSIIIMGIIPAEETFWGRKSRIEQVNSLLKESCSTHGFQFVEQAGCWSDANGDINRSLYFKDGLHLVKKGCTKLAKIYTDAIQEAISSQKPTVTVKLQSTILNHQSVPLRSYY